MLWHMVAPTILSHDGHHSSHLQPIWPLWQPLQSLQPQPKVAARRHGYTQNHAHYQNQLDSWSQKTLPSGKHERSCSHLSLYGHCPPRTENTYCNWCECFLNVLLRNFMLTINHRTALKVLTMLTRISEEITSIVCVTMFCRKNGLNSLRAGYLVPIETTICGVKVYAVIAGKDLTEVTELVTTARCFHST